MQITFEDKEIAVVRIALRDLGSQDGSTGKTARSLYLRLTGTKHPGVRNV